MPDATLQTLTVGERHWLSVLFRRALFARVLLAAALHFAGVSGWFAPDEGTYASMGTALAQYWHGDLLLDPTQGQPLPAVGYFYLNGASFLAFGSVLPLKLLNAFLGAYSCTLVFRLAHGLFGTAVARRAALMAAFMPSLILWSALNIRDVWVVFLVLVISWASFRLLRSYSNRAFVVLLVAVSAVTQFRQYIFFAVALPPLLAFAVGRRRSLGGGFILALVAGAGIVFLVQMGAAKQATHFMDLEALSQARQNLTVGAGSRFEEGTDISTPAKALVFLPVGLVYFLFSPFPWQITSALKMFSLPEVLFLYWLTPSMLRGLRYIVRVRLRDCLQPLLFTLFLTVSYALGSGNVGTMYRHRAQVLVFYLIFAAVGAELTKRGPRALGSGDRYHAGMASAGNAGRPPASG